jgi:hypothetical protein
VPCQQDSRLTSSTPCRLIGAAQSHAPGAGAPAPGAVRPARVPGGTPCGSRSAAEGRLSWSISSAGRPGPSLATTFRPPLKASHPGRPTRRQLCI